MKIRLNFCAWLGVVGFISILFSSVYVTYKYDEKIQQLQSDQAKIEKRINNLTLATQTKDKELEAGMRNNYQGLIYKLDF